MIRRLRRIEQCSLLGASLTADVRSPSRRPRDIVPAVERTARLLVPLWAVSFLASLGFSLVLPFLVFVVTAHGGNAFVMGAIGAISSGSQLVGASWLGRLSDRLGRKRVLLVSQLGGVVAWGVFLLAMIVPSVSLVRVDTRTTGAFVLTLPLLLVVLSRAFDGAVDGSVSVANAYIADVTDEKDRKAGFGRLGAAWSLGFVVGPTLAGLLARGEGGVITVVVLAMLLSTVGAAVVAWMLPELPARATRLDVAGSACAHKALGGGAKECTAPPPSADLRQLFRIPRLPAMLVVYFLVFLGFSVFTAVFPVHAVDELGWSSNRLGLFFGVLSLALVVTQSLLLPALGRRFDEPVLAFAGSLLVALGYLLMVWKGDASTYIAGALYGVGNGLMWPAYLTLFSEAGPASLQGTVQGVGSSVGSGAAIVGTLGGGVLYTNMGARAFFVPAAILAVTAFLCLRLGPASRDRLRPVPAPRPGGNLRGQ